MQKNDTVEVIIEDIGVNGEGIGKVNDYTLFIKDAVIGDVVEAKIMKMKKSYGFARLMKVIQPSPYRVEHPVCPMARRCGGCQIQEMEYGQQLVFKEKKVRGNLLRIGEVPEELLDAVMEPIVGMETEEPVCAGSETAAGEMLDAGSERVAEENLGTESVALEGEMAYGGNERVAEERPYMGNQVAPYHYRNKAQFPVGTDKEGNIITGFYAGRTHDIMPNTDCVLGVEVNREILETIVAFMKEYGVSAYDEKTHTGLVRHILIRYGFKTKEIMVCLVINGKKLPHSGALVERLIKIDGMTSITLSPNEKRTNVIMGEDIKVLWGQSYITDYIGGVKYQISPLSFYQVNPVQTEKLYGLALEYAGLGRQDSCSAGDSAVGAEKRNEGSLGNAGQAGGKSENGAVVWDLYCGIGTISLFLARRAKQVYGVEIVPQAIEDAKRNARINGITNAQFYVGKAEEVLPQYYETYKKEHGGQTAHADVIVVDPPRKGCEESLLRTMVDMRPERIVYVSCDSATLARDVKYLRGNGYEIERARAVDMFPHTVHVETVVLMSRVSNEPCRTVDELHP